ncbi:MAG TPA: hypothetical protein VI521_00450, partial [Candidatus Babeliales bacterium]|nr:hypothetical protein [Candidatus Babeliales bacterium]
TLFLMQPLCAADKLEDVFDVTGTPSSSQMREIKKFLLTNPTDQELQAYTRKAAPFMGARDASSKHAKLGAMFNRLKKAAEVEASRDQLKQDLLKARQQIEAMKQAQKKDGHIPSAVAHDQKTNEADSAQITLEGQKLDKLSARIQDLEDAIEGTEGKPGLRALLNEKDQEIAQLKQAQKKDGHTPSAAVHDQKTNEADSAQITLLKRNAVRAKIVIGCMSAFIIVDKVVIPIIRKCRSAWRDRHDKHKRADAWTALRTRFQKAQK